LGSVYVEAHMTDDCEAPTVSRFVQEALSRGHTVAYDRRSVRALRTFMQLARASARWMNERVASTFLLPQQLTFGLRRERI
jgi:hypothetical protein